MTSIHTPSSDQPSTTLREVVPPLMGPREYLPISSNAAIPPGTVVPVRAYSLHPTYGSRLVIRHPERWSIRGIYRVDVRQEGKIPRKQIAGQIDGPAFAASAPESAVQFGHLFGSSEDLILDVAYVGPLEGGERFEACLFCTEHPDEVAPSPRRDKGEIGTLALAANRPARQNEAMTIFPLLGGAWPENLQKGFYPEQIVLENAEDWAVNDICIHGRSILLQSQDGDLPGVMFSGHPHSPPLEIGELAPGDDFKIVATYLGSDIDRATLRCTLSGPIRAADRSSHRLSLLPMSAPLDYAISTNTIVQITARPQPGPSRVPEGYEFRSRRIVLDRPDDWSIHDFKIGNNSQSLTKGDIPGVAFSHDAVPDLICARPASPRQDVVLIASHVNEARASGLFLCGIAGDIVPAPQRGR